MNIAVGGLYIPRIHIYLVGYQVLHVVIRFLCGVFVECCVFAVDCVRAFVGSQRLVYREKDLRRSQFG